MRRLVSAFVVGPVLLLAGTAAMALGMGRVNTLSDLGSPLDFSVALSAEPSDALDLDCIRAEVYTGDARVAPEMVRLRLTRRGDGTPVALRVSTGTRMDEPVVNVEVVLDCGVRVSRRYVVFIDPPQLSLAEAGGAAGAVAGAAAGGALAAQRDPAARDLAPAAPPRRVRSTRTAEGSASRTVRPGGTGVASSAARQRRAEAAAAARQARASAQAPAEGGSRLKLESAPPTAGTAPLRERAAVSGAAGVGAAATGAAAAALQSAASAAQTVAAASAAAASGAASSAIAAASAASGSVGGLLSELAAKAEADAQALNAERLRSLEESLARLRTDNQTMQKSMAELQARLQEAEAGRYANPLVYGLLALLGLLLLAVIALLWRQASLRKESEWLRAAAAQGDGPGLANPPQPAVRSMTMPSAAAAVRAGGAAAGAAALAAGAKARATESAEAEADAAAVVDDEPAAAGAAARATGTAIASLATQPVPTSTASQAGAALRPHEKTSIHDPRREVSVEELIDLEQQADFFVVLGQDDAAVELLMGHVQGTGGASPLPYLKLLEIHRRRDERAAYDEVRERFNRRFSAFAPEWDAHSGHDRSLEGYPAVIERLQSVWREPTAAMDELAALLFQRDPTAQTFDLPAYGELLFLYSMARELAEDPDAQDGVDLLLPLDDFGPASGSSGKAAGLVAGGVAVAAAAVAAAPSSGSTDMSFSPLPRLDELPSIPSLPEQPGTYPAPLAYDPPEPKDPGTIDFDSDLLDLNISDEPEEPKGPLSKY